MSKKPKTKSEPSPVRDFVGFALLALTLFLFLALISYHPLDPSFNTRVAADDVVVRNYCGILGSYISDLLMQGFGYAAYLWPLSLLGVTWAVVFRPTWLLASARIAGFFLILVSASLGLALVGGEQPQIPAWGGLVGHLLRLGLVKYVGEAGTYVLAGLFLLLSAVLIGRFSFRGFLDRLSWFVHLQRRAIQSLTAYSLRLGKWFNGLLEKESKELEKGLEVIREDTPPKIPTMSGPRKGNGKAVKNLGKLEETGSFPQPEIPIVVASQKQKKESLPQFHSLDGEEEVEKEGKAPRNYKLPNLTLLDAPNEQDLNIDREELFQNAQILETKLKDFGVFGKVVEVQPGPVVTMYEFEPAPGVKVNQIMRLNDDLALALKALSVRMTPLPGKSVVGIEVANRERQIVYLKDVIASDTFSDSVSRLTGALGKDISGMPYTVDLRKMPHLLMAGATGSGKSVSVNSLILSILYKSTPDEVRMILVDPKMLELSLYDGIPHLLLPVVTDPRKAAAALRWAVLEMERRYRLMADLGVRNIEGYNKKVLKIEKEEKPEKEPLLDGSEDKKTKPEEHDGKFPYIVIVLDELADLMMVASRDVEESIIRLAQMARAAGIHLVLATQRPSVDVITGVIKANMPARISFQVSSKVDSRTILDTNGAELLLGAGDCLYLPPGTSKLERVHGAFVSDAEVKAVTDFWKEQGAPDYDLEILKTKEEEEASSGGGEDEEMYQQALNVVRNHGVASISMIQRKLRIGYNRAARLVERMEEEGLLAPGEVGKPREVLMSRFEI